MEKASANPMKEVNINHVRRIMKEIGAATKPELSKLTGLSVVTINSIVRELLSSGELVEDELVSSGGGRPAVTYRFNSNFSHALVIHFHEKQGKDTAVITVMNLHEDLLMRNEHTFERFDMKLFYEMIEEALSHFPSIKVIGIGIPGQAVGGRITISDYEDLLGVPFVEELQNQFGLPVILENDVNASISGYCFRNQMSEEQCVLGIYFPEKYPPGMGIWLNGSIVKGKHGMAGEIQFLPLDVNWRQLVEKEQFVRTACKVIQSINAVLAPHYIVIYRENVDANLLFQQWESFVHQYEIPSTPEIVISNTFHHDFEYGMQRLTLQQLQPAMVQIK
ncbi:ROK family protein [Marinicrinis lubricantis]|uniref:ROK family protein n=1 Tax=Marinicrinis lubricantis TaxID=2086470 RepID=A0ABW1IK15_9BACL